jgi:hypothetical protein
LLSAGSSISSSSHHWLSMFFYSLLSPNTILFRTDPHSIFFVVVLLPCFVVLYVAPVWSLPLKSLSMLLLVGCRGTSDLPSFWGALDYGCLSPLADLRRRLPAVRCGRPPCFEAAL